MVIFIGFILFTSSFFVLSYSFFYIRSNNYIRLCSLYFLCTSSALVFLTFSFLVSDFSIYIVLLNTYSAQAVIYKVFSLWCSHEGSILFWYWCFSAYFFVTVLFVRFFNLLFFRWYFLLNLFVFFYIYLFSNPYLILDFFVSEGLELSFILHNPLVSIHPPILYAGYLFTFFISVYCLFAGYYCTFTWSFLYYIYSIIFLAWVFLSLGIGLGSFWAYMELGWGGWWYWDSIENLAFLPWLVLVICLHSVKHSLVHNYFFISGVAFGLFSFLIVLLGTFFLRSGNLESIHNFVVDFARGYALVFLVLLFLALYGCAWISSYFMSSNTFIYQKSFYFYFVLCGFLSFFLYIYWGTFFPFFVKIFFSTGVSLDPYFFNWGAGYFCCFLLVSCIYYFLSHRISIFISGLSCLLYLFFYNSLLSFGTVVWFVVVSCMLYVCYIFFFFERRWLSGFLHFVFLCVVSIGFLSVFHNYDFVLLLKPYRLVTLFSNYSVMLGYPTCFRNEYFLSFTLPVYLFWDSCLLDVLYLEKSLFFNSKTFFVKPEVLSHWLNDFYFVLGSSGSEGGWYVKVYLKYYMLFFWLSWLIFFVVCFNVFYIYLRLTSRRPYNL